MAELIDGGRAVDIVTLSEELAKRKEVEAVGGVAYLASLTEGLPHRLSIDDMSASSRTNRSYGSSSTSARPPSREPPIKSEEALEVLNAAESSLLEVTERGITRGFAGIPEIVRDSFGTIDNLYKEGREVTGLATHFDEFDRMTSGLQNSELTIIAARPSMGKTAGPSTLRRTPPCAATRPSPSSRSKCRRSRCCDACSPLKRWSIHKRFRKASCSVKTRRS